MPNIIIENGALNIRVGYESSQFPTIVFQNKLAYMGSKSYLDFSSNYVCGNDVDLIESVYNVNCPIQGGRITDWGAMELIWKEVLERSGLSSFREASHTHNTNDIYFVFSVNYTKNCFEHILEYFLSNYVINKISFGLDAINALYSTGKKSGIVVDSGDSLTKIVPILEDYVDVKMIWQSKKAGRSLSQKIQTHLLNNLGEPVFSQSSIDFLKSNYFQHWVSDEEIPQTVDKIDLPDGTSVQLGSERYNFSESLFQQDDVEHGNLVDGYFQAISNLDRESKRHMIENTLFVGGNTKIKNFEQRFVAEAGKINSKMPISKDRR